MDFPNSGRDGLVRQSLRALGYSSPNPPVVAFATNSQKNIWEFAHTQITGKHHAERELYTQLALKFPEGIPEHELFVTLEPCQHWGRTPPCMELIQEYKPKKIHFGHKDPNPIHRAEDSKYQSLKSSECWQQSPILKSLSQEVLSGFFSRIQKKRPKILLKMALNQRGFFAPWDKSRIAISSSLSKGFLAYLRAKVDAVLVGAGTVRADNPNLSFRPQDWKKAWDTNISQLDMTKFSHPSLSEEPISVFWRGMLDTFFSEEEWSFHNLEFVEYQPLRCFLIGSESSVSDDFIKIQEATSLSHQRLKTHFYLLEKDYSSTFLNRLDLLSEYEPIFLPDDSEKQADMILEDLGKKEINLLLVEGGNSLYKSFSEVMDSEDFLLKMQNQEVDFEGISPEVSFEDWKESFLWNWGKENWTVMQKEKH